MIPDPRTHVTPDAFQVSQKLLGWPLASPSRRLVAILMDLIVVGVLTLLGWRVLGVMAATGFLWVAVRNPTTSAKAKAFRWTGGCFGALILFVIVVSTGEIAQRIISGIGSSNVTLEDDSLIVPGPGQVPGLRNLLTGFGNLTEFRRASTAEDAERLAVRLFTDGAELGMDADEVEEILLNADVDDDAGWDAEEVIRTARRRAADGPSEAEDGPGDGDTTDEDIPTPRALLEYAELLDQPDSALDIERRQTLEAAILRAVGADSLGALRGRVLDLESDVRSAERTNDALREEVREAEEGGLLGRLYGTVDRLGLTFGWGALYFAFLLSWFNGLTPGKKLMGIRVLRLDGEPMTWFLAFERSGGYAAGFATGLLGFAQLLWDANRQAIHDRIAGTVVVVDGAKPTGALTRNPAGTPTP